MTVSETINVNLAQVPILAPTQANHILHVENYNVQHRIEILLMKALQVNQLAMVLSLFVLNL